MPASKTKKHKESNKHRYLTFSERINRVSINAIHRIKRPDEYDKDEDSRFHTTLMKWRDQDRSLHFEDFLSEISSKSKNYKMIVHYKDEITSSVLKHLGLHNSLALHALSELLVSLCVDLRSEFYPHFKDAFLILTKLMNTQEVDRLEWIFNAISLLFKHLWKYMVADIDTVLALYEELMSGEHPDHISLFAAESITFLLRKVSDQKNIFKKLFCVLGRTAKSRQGLAKILFNVLKGVDGTLYSRTEMILPQLLSCLYDEQLTSSDVFASLNLALELLAQHVKKDHSKPVWDAILSMLKFGDIAYSTYILKLVKTWCLHGNGVLILSQSDLTEVLENLCKTYRMEDKKNILELCKVLILTKSENFGGAAKMRLINYVIKSKIFCSELVHFWRNVLEFVNRNTDCRRIMLKYCQNEFQNNTEEVVQLLCDYILSNSTLPNDAKELLDYQPFHIDYALVSRGHGVTKIQDGLKAILMDENSKVHEMWMALLALQHIRPLPSSSMKMLTNLFGQPLSHFCDSLRTYLAVIRMLLQTGIVLDAGKRHTMLISLCRSCVKYLLSLSPDDVICDQNFLFLLDIICLFDRESISDVRNHPSLVENLCRNLSSHDAILRKFSLRILSSIHPNEKLFETCLTVEETPATVQTYRTKAINLGKLKYSPDKSFQAMAAILRFLLSNLYINFSSYWPIVQEKIASFLPKDSKSELWPVLLDLLDAASKTAKHVQLAGEKSVEGITNTLSAEKLFAENGLTVTFSTQANVKIDHFNYRMLLWKTLIMLPADILEKYNRRIVSLFLQFLEDEYFKVDKSYAPYQDLMDKSQRKASRVVAFGKNVCIKTLNIYLQVLAKFKNPVACFSAMKLKAIYEDLLMHGDAEVQKSALKCLIAYKEKSLITFEEQLFSLLDDDKIKETMVQFNLEDIPNDKRSNFVPALFRLLYGRIVSKSGVTGQPRKRRSLILRFLSGLTQQEMQAFIMLAIKPVRHYIDERVLNQAVNENFSIGSDLTEVVPLSRQQGILSTISEVIGKHSNLLSKYMFDYLLKLLLSFYLSYRKMISTIESIDDLTDLQRTLSFLRALCKQVNVMVNTLVEFWPESEVLSCGQVESIFFVLVDPHIHKLHHECIMQPNSLLNFFNELTKQTRFFPIMGHKVSADGINTPIEAVIKVLIHENTLPSVTGFIMEMLVRLLGDEDGDEDSRKSDEALMKKMLVNIKSDIISADKTSILNIGLDLMVNYVADILKYFIVRLKEKNSAVLVQSQLRLLIALGKHVTDMELSNELAELLLGHLCGIARAGRTVSVSVEQETVRPALMSLVAIPLTSSFIHPIAKLFSRVKSRECRLVLMEAFQKACADTSGKFGKTMMKVCSIIQDLNAWDKRFIEEVDYDSRLAGFQEVIDWLDCVSAESLFEKEYCGLVCLAHNCIFTLENHSSDLSLREMSSRCLEQAIGLAFKHCVTHADFYQSVVSAIILPAIKRGLNSVDENQRHEWLRLLVMIVKHCSQENAFSSMKILRNEFDPDADFFSNVQHIQLHRRTRAFRKLAQIILEKNNFTNTIPYSVVTFYLLPLAMLTIKSKDLSKHLHLRDACLEVVSACAMIMPWSAYVRFLRQNMALISRHDQGVKIVCNILHSFHFDVASIPKEKAMTWEESFVSAKAKAKIDGNDRRLDEPENNEVEQESKTDLALHEDLTATIYTTVVCDILPRLCENLTSKLNSDSSHKLADSLKFSDIDQCTIRAPLAVAVVSLLRNLPERIMHLQLPSVVLKIVAFLRHHYVEVRSAACKVIVQISQLLEPAQLHIILKELKVGLARGYQKHVLIHTVNAIFSQLEGTLDIGDLEKCSGLILKILTDDLFGKGEEERGVEKIKSKTPEARGRSKAYNVYRVLAKFSKRESLLSIISPLKEILDSTHDHKKRKIVESALEEINQGLQDNSGLNAEDILIFLHGLLTESLPGIFSAKQSDKESEQRKMKPDFHPESCLLLSTEPERYGVKETKKTQKTNLHLLIEFSLRLLNSSLKRQAIRVNNPEHLKMLDPLVEILQRCLDSPHSKTVTEAIRCLTKLLRSSLPSLPENATTIIKSLFKIMRENSKGSANNELASATYKALSLLCNSDLGSKLSDTQLQVLLGYAEEMLYDRDRQSHAFNVIQSILSRNLKCDEIIEVMEKIRDICIQSHDNAAMVHARQVYMYFLSNYPMTTTKLIRHLEFILAQLTFEYESGRLSSLELVASIISSFPDPLISSSSGTMFVPLSAMLLNDESVKCRKLAAHVVKILLNKLEAEDRDRLFNFVLQWYNDVEHKLHQQLAAVLVGLFAEVEEAGFRRRLSDILPVLSSILNSIVEESKQYMEDAGIESPVNDDHFIFHQLSAWHTILRICKLARDSSWGKEVSSVMHCVETFLLHPHMWVRIASSQIFGTVFSSWNPDELAESSTAKESPYFVNPHAKIRILAARFCKQIHSPLLDPKLADQCVKNLLFVVRVLDKAKWKKGLADKDDASDSEGLPSKLDRISILLYGLLKTAKREAANNIKETSKRTAILKFYAAACLALDTIDDYLPIVVELIHRESERKIVEEDKEAMALKQLAGEVLDLVKTKVGSASFTKAYASVQKRLTTLRRNRKRQRDVELVADPQRAATVKRRRQQKKKDQRKRKIASFRPEYGVNLSKKKKNIRDLDH